MVPKEKDTVAEKKYKEYDTIIILEHGVLTYHRILISKDNWYLLNNFRRNNIATLSETFCK